MNAPARLKITLFLLFTFACFAAFSQSNYDPVQDDEFNVFLLVFATVVLCGMFGAALVGALIASLIAVGVFSLIGFGILSASVAVGLYKRSLTAGFKTLLMIVFGTGCGLCGAALGGLAQHTLHVAPSFVLAASLGFVGGVFGGLFLALISAQSLRFILAKAVAKLKAV